MKKIIFLFAVIFATMSCNKVDINAEKSNVEATVKDFYAAFEKFDYDSLGTFCTPGFTAFEAGTTFPDLKSFIDMIKSFNIQSFKVDVEFSNTNVLGDMAYTVADFKANYTAGNMEFNLKTKENYILKKINNKWLIDYFHSTHLSNDPVLTKGSMVGFHVIKGITLKPGVTMEQAEEFMVKTYIPEFNKLSPDIRLIALKGLRGAEKDKMGVAYIFASDDVRNQLWIAEGKYSPAGEEYFKRFDTLNAEAGKLYTIDSTVYTDWLVK
jgi:ketosteroid isomerase-like protein